MSRAYMRHPLRQATNLSVPQDGVDPQLVEQAQMMSVAAVSDKMPLDELSRDLERLFP
jgi:chemosensory pili system protein ChpA (sensor histidine kinase/response regulator)